MLTWTPLPPEIAMNLAGGEWRIAGLISLVREISKGGLPREKWRAKPRESESVAERATQRRSSADNERRRASCSRCERETGPDNWLEPKEFSTKL